MSHSSVERHIVKDTSAMHRSNNLITLPAIEELKHRPLSPGGISLLTPVEDVTRREFITSTGAIALAAALIAACGSDDDPGSPADDMIDFIYEDITTRIPRNPRRVVVMEGRGDLDFALSVGYPVLATGNFQNTGELPDGPFEGRLEGARLLPNMYPDPDYELLAELEPDLIVQRANAFRGDFYGNEVLARIAPVLSVECNRADWRTDLEEQARLLGRDQVVSDQLADYDAAVARARAEVGHLLEGRSVALMTVAQGASVVLWTSSFGTEIAHDLGMEQPFRNAEEFMESGELPAESFGRLQDIDLIIAQAYDDRRHFLDDVETWRRLRAVEASRVFHYPPNLNNGMALIATSAIDVFVEAARSLASD